MGRGTKYLSEQVVNSLRQIEVAVANGRTTSQAAKEAGIAKQTYFRWGKEYGGLKIVRQSGGRSWCTKREAEASGGEPEPG
jgi:hypothetical protein